MGNEIKMPLEIARGICQAEASCHSEGLSSNDPKLMAWIAKNYPQLKEEFAWIGWENWGK